MTVRWSGWTTLDWGRAHEWMAAATVHDPRLQP